MKRGQKFDPKTDVDLFRLRDTFDRASASRELVSQTYGDVIRAYDGEIKIPTVYRNLARRIKARDAAQDLTP